MLTKADIIRVCAACLGSIISVLTQRVGGAPWKLVSPSPEDEEQPASGAEERVHAEEADAEAGALTWQELFSGWGGIMRRGVGALVGGLGRIRGLVGVGEAGGTGGTEGEADAFGGREGLVHRFAAAWVRVRAAFGDG